MFIAYFALTWLALLASAVLLGDRLRKAVIFLAPAASLLALILCFGSLEPWQRLLCTSIELLYVIKTVVLLRHSRAEVAQFSLSGIITYMSVWPGMDPEPFRKRGNCDESGVRFARGWVFGLGGVILAFFTAALQPQLGTIATGWLGFASLIMIIHFGYADILTSVLRLCGWNTGPLFEEPLKSSTLRDFWSKRWNLAFVEMDKLLFFKPLAQQLGAAGGVFAVFVISGLLHDLCISYSAGGGWGLPTLYFLLQGAAVLAEKTFIKRDANPVLTRLWTWACLLLPLPLLFTEQFRDAFILPLFQSLHGAVAAHDLQWYLSMALWCGALGHFVTLGAGLQVPFRLKWKEDLAKLTTFNRKIFLTYAGYTGLMIVSLGTLALLLHDEILRGDRAAVYLSVLIAIFWGLRVVIDYLSFGHKDWPEGPMFVIGHTCLTTLFIFLTLTFGSAAIWHLVIR